jgi:colanic acid/amylovoran biosynthesis glycosyltransferase
MTETVDGTASPLRIAVVVSRFPELSETFVLQEIVALLQAGHRVDIYADRSDCVQPRQPEIDQYNLLERTVVPAPGPPGRFLRNLHLARVLVGPVSRGGVRVLPLAKYPRPIPGRVLRYAGLAPGSALPYDVIHCHFGPNGTKAVAMRDVRLLAGPVVTTFHGYDVSSHLHRHGVGYYSQLFSRGDLFLAVSDYWRKSLVRIGCPADRLRVHHVGIDCASLEFEPRAVRSGQPVRAISVARLTEKKGLEYGIRAVAQLTGRFPSLEYRIIGDGPLRKRLEAVIDGAGLRDRVTLLGARTQQEVRKELRASHIFLAPSVTGTDGDQEGIPVSIMEAMATGIPVVSSFHSGIPELVEDKRTGLLAPERDVDGLARRIASLLDDPDAWGGMVAAARERVEKDFNSAVQHARLSELFAHLAFSSRAPGYRIRAGRGVGHG